MVVWAAELPGNSCRHHAAPPATAAAAAASASGRRIACCTQLPAARHSPRCKPHCAPCRTLQAESSAVHGRAAQAPPHLPGGRGHARPGWVPGRAGLHSPLLCPLGLPWSCVPKVLELHGCHVDAPHCEASPGARGTAHACRPCPPTSAAGKAVSLAYARQGARLVLVGAQQDKAELEKARAAVLFFVV